MPSEEREGGEGGSGIVPELRLLWSLAWPSGLSMVLRMGTMQTTMIVVGHMGTEELAAVALGNMWVAMVGMTLVYGGFSGLDTLRRRPTAPRTTRWSGSGPSARW